LPQTLFAMGLSLLNPYEALVEVAGRVASHLARIVERGEEVRGSDQGQVVRPLEVPSFLS